MFKKKDEIFRRELAGHKHCRGLSVEMEAAQQQVMRKTAATRNDGGMQILAMPKGGGAWAFTGGNSYPQNVIYILAARIVP